MAENFPQYAQHNQARCFKCDEPLKSPIVDSGNPPTRGKWARHCDKCGLNTYYSLAPKTREQWRGSGLCLNEFLQVGDLVDEDMADYFLCVLPPATHSSLLIQIGEPYSHVNGKPTFATIKKTADGWEYRGNCHIREPREPQKS